MTRLKTLASMALAVTLLQAGAAIAQDPTAEDRAASVWSASLPSIDNLDIDFPGGTLREYLGHLQSRAGVNNVVTRSKEIGEVTMPAVNLTRVTFADAIELPYFLATLPEDRWLSIEAVGSNKSIFVVDLRSQEASSMMSDPANRSISFDFEGGSLSQFVAALQDAAGAQKVLLRGETENFEMPPLELENVTLHSVLMAINGDQRQTATGDQSRVSSFYRDGVYVVEVEQARRNASGAAETAEVRSSSWTVIDLLGPGRLEIDDVLSAVEAAVEVSGTGASTKIRFHEPSSLLIASGPFDTLQLVDLTLEKLEETADRRFAKYAERRELRAQLAQVEAKLQEFRDAVTQAEEIVAAFEAGDPDTTQREASFYESRLGPLLDQVADLRARAEAIRFELSEQE